VPQNPLRDSRLPARFSTTLPRAQLASDRQPSTITLPILDAPSDVEDCSAAHVNDFASSWGICEQIPLTGHGSEGRAIEDRDTPQPEGLTLSLQVGATRSLRSAELDPEIGNLARKNRIGDDRNKANITRSTRMAGEILSRSALCEHESLLAQVARRYRKIARIDARARRHATREHHGEPEEDYELHTISTRECGEW
jgi:hypothetical protein